MRGRLVLTDWQRLDQLRHHFPARSVIGFQERGEILARLFIRLIADNPQDENLGRSPFCRRQQPEGVHFH